MTLELRNVRVRNKRPGLMAAFLLWTLGAWGTFAFLPTAFLPAILAQFGSLGLVVLANRWREERSGTLRVDGENISLDGVALTARRGVSKGYLGKADQHVVRLARGWRGYDFEVIVDNEADGERLLAALELDRAHRTTRFVATWGTPADGVRFSAWVTAGTIATIVASVGLAERSPALSLLVIILWTLAAATLALRFSVSVTVGVDGVLIKRFLAGRRFVSYREITSVALSGTVVTLVLDRGPTIRVNAGGLGHKSDRTVFGRDIELHAAALARQIEEAKRASEGGSSASTALLARGGRSLAEWVRAIAAADTNHAGFRGAALPAEELWRVVDDPSAPPTARVGAAVALRSHMDDAGRARLRVAGETSAAPQLRVALTAIADAADDELGDLLESVDDVALDGVAAVTSLSNRRTASRRS